MDDTSRTMPRGEVGELMVRGPIVMMGYFGDEAKTRETLELAPHGRSRHDGPTTHEACNTGTTEQYLIRIELTLDVPRPLPFGSVGQESHLVPSVTSLSMRGAAFLTFRVDPNEVF